MPPLPPVTRFLMLLCTAVFCLQQIFFPILDNYAALWPLQSGNFMPWQLITYAFLHGGISHLAFNLFGLWMFGGELEQLWGEKRYLLFILASAVSAALVQLVVTLFFPAPPTIGISGALYGLLLGWAMLFPNRIVTPMLPPIPMRARTFALVYGGLELFFGVSGTWGGVAHFAHLGGMLGGWLMILYWRGKPPFGRRGGSGPRRLH